MLQEHLTKSLLTRLTPPHVLQSTVETMVSLDQILNVSNQLIVLWLRQTGKELELDSTI